MKNKMKVFWAVEFSLAAVLVYLLYFFIIPVNYSDKTEDGWEFHFTDGCYTPSAVQSGNKSACAGWTWENRTIYIVSNRSRNEQYITCSHEILHNLIDTPDPKDEEALVEYLDDYVRFKACDELIK